MNTFLEAVLNGWWQGIVLALLVWIVLRDVRRISAATRLAIWQVTLLFVLLLPALQRVPAMLLPSAQAPEDLQRATVTQPFQPLVKPPSLPILQEPFRPKPAIELPDRTGPLVFLLFSTALAILQLLRLLLGYAALRRLKRRAIPLSVELPVRLARSLRVLVSEEIGMPMAAGYFRPAILLPRYVMESLSPEEVRYILLHESAHLHRYDDWVVLGERLIRAIFCFQPAVYFIGRQMDRDREMACDDWVIAHAGQTKRYASVLARLAELASSGRVPALAMGTGRGKQIFSRLEAMFDGARNRIPLVSGPVVLIAGSLLLLLIFQGAQFSHLLGLSNFPNRWIESDGTNKREIRLRGEVEFTPDDQDVQSMSPGAMLVVEQSDEFRTWRIEFEPDPEGAIQRRYFSGRTQRPFDSEARNLLNIALPRWVRELGRNIPERLSRDLRDRGVEGALENIRPIRNSGVKRAYLKELFEQTRLNTGELAQALKVAAGLNSDHDKRQLLESFYDRNLDRGRNLDASSLDLPLLGLIDSIHSDEHRRKLLIQSLERGTVSDISLARLVRSAAAISSDSAKADVLLHASQVSKEGVPGAFFDAASTIHSGDQLERLLTQVVTVHGHIAGVVAQVLRTAASINSDDQKAKLLIACAGLFNGNTEAVQEASVLLTSIHSDGDRRRALEALIAADGRDAETLGEILSQTSRMNSDEDKSHLLLKVAGTFTEQEQVRNAFFSALGAIRSSGDQRRVLIAVLARTDLSLESLYKVSRAVARMSALEDQTAVLKALAARG